MCRQHRKHKTDRKKNTQQVYKLTRLSLLWFPPSSCVLPKLVNESPSVHPLQDFPFVVISAGGEEEQGRRCQTEFSASPSEASTYHKHLRRCHINSPQVEQRVRKWRHDFIWFRWRRPQHEKSALLVSTTVPRTRTRVICCQQICWRVIDYSLIYR